mgnify:CR=1 FL=1
MRRLRTIARIAAVYLLLGFVMTWAVAWSLASFVTPSMYAERNQTTGDVDGATFTRYSEMRYAWGTMRATYVGGVMLDGSIMVDGTGGTHHQFTDLGYSRWLDLPRANAILSWDITNGNGWGYRHDIVEQGFDGAWDRGMEEARGFPVVCLWWARRLQTSLAINAKDQEQVVGGIELRNAAGRGGNIDRHTFRALPYYPIWSGLVLNTAFYALLFFAVVRIGRRCKHAGQYRWGVCPKCKYERSFDYRTPCPECGHSASGSTHALTQAASS